MLNSFEALLGRTVLWLVQIWRVQGMNTLRLIRLGNWVLATASGSVGVFCLSLSFGHPMLALNALFLLLIGTALEMANSASAHSQIPH